MIDEVASHRHTGKEALEDEKAEGQRPEVAAEGGVPWSE
jgi:hypothetical protein